jgi:hypothetical protein
MKIVLVLALAACSAAQQGETLSDSIRSYNDGVRWERFGVAAIHVPPKQRAAFVDDQDQRSKDVKITDSEVVKVDAKSERAAKVEVKIEWYRESDNKVHETRSVQTWERHGKLWLVVDEVRLRGDEMPGLPEPVARD